MPRSAHRTHGNASLPLSPGARQTARSWARPNGCPPQRHCGCSWPRRRTSGGRALSPLASRATCACCAIPCVGCWRIRRPPGCGPPSSAAGFSRPTRPPRRTHDLASMGADTPVIAVSTAASPATAARTRPSAGSEPRCPASHGGRMPPRSHPEGQQAEAPAAVRSAGPAALRRQRRKPGQELWAATISSARSAGARNSSGTGGPQL
jgi:hypothetical protein